MKDAKKTLQIILSIIKNKREESNLSQQKLGEKIGMSQNAYHKLEAGTTRLDMFRYLQICYVLKLNPMCFYTHSLTEKSK